MRIRFERSGGLANIPLSADVDVDALGRDERRHVEQLVADSRFFDLPGSPDPAGGVDRFVYRIAIDDGAHTHMVDVGETAASPELRPLIQWLTTAARRR